jgi:serine protease Do
LQDAALWPPITVVIRSGTTEIALGTVVRADGWVVAKRTLVDGQADLNCSVTMTHTGRLFVPARIAAASVEHDLALVKLEGPEAQNLPLPNWAEAPVACGQLVASAISRTMEPLQFSVVGDVAREAPAEDTPQILVDVQPSPSEEPVIHGIPTFALTAEADGFRSAFKPGDILTAIDGIPTPTFAEYCEVVKRSLYARGENGEYDYSRPAPGSIAGEPVILTVRRDGKELPIRIIKVHSGGGSPLFWRLSPLSIRREGFPSVFPHDGRLRPEQCGSPVVDLAGRVVGINIARADSTRTFAIPADVVQKVVAELLESVN